VTCVAKKGHWSGPAGRVPRLIATVKNIDIVIRRKAAPTSPFHRWTGTAVQLIVYLHNTHYSINQPWH
jgi:hypothetical protein